jgi:hypothetical protein
MIGFVLYILLGFVTAGMAVLGGHVSSNNHRHRIAFYVLGTASLILIIFTGLLNYSLQREGDRSRNALERNVKSLENSSLAIANMSKEALRIGNLNSQLQEQLLKSTETITNLSKTNIDNTTGGDSFCIIEPCVRRNVWMPQVIHAGQYPLYDVRVRITDYKNLKYLTNQQNKTMAELFTHDININIGNISSAVPFVLYWKVTIPLDKKYKQYKKYNMFFTARNGSWDQFLRFYVTGWGVSPGIVSATKVQKREGNQIIILYEKVDGSFPRNVHGEVDWD